MVIIIIFVADYYFSFCCETGVILFLLKPTAVLLDMKEKRCETADLQKDAFEH
jgi:hypothetical protein